MLGFSFELLWIPAIVILGIVLIGVIGFSIDLLMRWGERVLVPWKGRA